MLALIGDSSANEHVGVSKNKSTAGTIIADVVVERLKKRIGHEIFMSLA
jgi:hypothetical protein